MRASRLLVILALSWVLACARDQPVRDGGALAPPSEDAPSEGDQLRIVPEGLQVSALAGGTGVLALTALTLQRRAGAIELYAALKNVGEVPACSAALSVELFDASGQSLAAGIAGLLTQRFYRSDDGAQTIAACVGPGDVTMAAILDLPAELAIEQVQSLVYRCPYFALQVAPVPGITFEGLQRVQRGAQVAFQGTLVNGLEVALRRPSLSVFPVNRAGRPLGVATGSAEADLAPAGTWSFETSTVDDPGVDQLAFPAGELAE